MQMLGSFVSPTQWFILAIVFLLVFGSSRLPELARNLGKSLGILKKARREFEDELIRSQTSESSAPKSNPVELEAQAPAKKDAAPEDKADA